MTRSGWEEERLLHLEKEVRALCQQIEHLAAQIPDKRDRAYAGVAQEYLWTMYRRVCERAVARHTSRVTNQEASDDPSPARRPDAFTSRSESGDSLLHDG